MVFCLRYLVNVRVICLSVIFDVRMEKGLFIRDFIWYRIRIWFFIFFVFGRGLKKVESESFICSEENRL